MAARQWGNSEGSIYRRTDGRWVASVSLGGSKRKYLYARTRREAAEKLKVALRDQQQGLLVAGPRQTVARYLAHWLEATKPSVRPRTFASYDLNVRRVVPIIGKLALEKLGPADLQRLYSVLLERGLSRRTVEQCHTVLHLAFKQAVRWGLLARNPAEHATAPRPGRRELTTLTRAQVQQLFAVSRPEGRPDRWHALWVTFCTTGLRLGEATALRWTDVDLTTGRLTVARSLSYQRGPVFSEPKTGRSRRTVLLSPFTVQTLREHRRVQAAERLKAGPLWQDHELIFCRPDGRPLAPWQVLDALHQALDRAGLPRIRVHDLRHTVATLLLEDGASPKHVQELLGHSTVVLTLDVYSHVTPAMHQDVAARLDRLFGTAAEASG